MARTRVERTRFIGLGRVLRDISKIEGGVRIRRGNEFALVNMFVPKDGTAPTLRIMDSIHDPLMKFLSRNSDGICFQNFLEYADNCYMSADGEWVLVRDELASVVRGGEP